MNSGLSINNDIPTGIAFSENFGGSDTNNGTKMYILYLSELVEYNLSTAWDPMTATWSKVKTNSQLSIESNVTGFTDLSFNYDGTELYLTQRDDNLFPDGYRNADKLFKYSLSTPWDIDTISFVDSLWFDPGASVLDTAGEGKPRALDYVEDGNNKYVFVSGGLQSKIYRYDITNSFTFSDDSIAHQDLPVLYHWSGAGDLYNVQSLRVDVYGKRLVLIDGTAESTTGFTKSENMVY